MYLKKLEISGFKSFAHKTILEFEPGIISVVGPNGSGKSNIADALRWVFGEQSMKLLRSKKSEDVIFAGSDQKARLGGSSVSIFFDNSDGKLPVDYGEVVITRRLYRDGNSEYLINGNKVRLVDIQDIILKSGFGQSSYYVIGQGMIDQLILGGPAAIKELLEEAAGVKPYYIKRERTLRKLFKTETNLEQAQALINEILPRLRSLRRQTKRYEQRGEIEQELRVAEAQYYGNIYIAIKKQTDEAEEKLTIFSKQADELKREIMDLSSEIEKEETGGQEILKQNQEQTEKLQTLRKTKQELLEEQAVLKGQLRVTPLENVAPKVDWPIFRKRLQIIYKAVNDIFQGMQNDSFDVLAIKEQVRLVDRDFQNLLAETEVGQKHGPDNYAVLRQKVEYLDGQINQLTQKIEELEELVAGEGERDSERRQQFFIKERLLRTKQSSLIKFQTEQSRLSVELVRLSTRKETMEEEIRAALGEDWEEKIKNFLGQPIPIGLTEKIGRLKQQLEGIGRIDDLTMQEYKETESRYEHLTTQSEDLTKGVKDLKIAIAELDQIIKKEFDESFNTISEKFVEYFRILFGGGKASMTLIKEKPVDENMNLAEEMEEEILHKQIKSEVVGIVIKATPPGKKLSGIAALSGGERALTAIALLSAILAISPSPFVVLDEVDAALDEANSIRFGKILGSLAKTTQFITITHNRETMRQSHTLYGVTMGDDGVSRVLSLKLEQAAVYSTKN